MHEPRQPELAQLLHPCGSVLTILDPGEVQGQVGERLDGRRRREHLVGRDPHALEELDQRRGQRFARRGPPTCPTTTSNLGPRWIATRSGGSDAVTRRPAAVVLPA